ncbi:MAG TPA: 2-C-methyl-D-erythritol 4-phosphate cytidylyltransferase [Chthoniobacteraceae bacterium]|jgi:2-C-methyl-D-erythritol 4-phosphate cytidylyltransferase|nr:2-C-methyl-D-erythritol 4-phosphate cytidylyltransferase [Chthoniobacteraceae bacterium]
MVSAIIVAAGSSRRMGFDKLLTPLAGKPVLWHSLKAFSDCKDIDEILVVTREEQMDAIEKLVTDEKFKKVRKVISGGGERHISVWNGLQAVNSEGSEFIAIHDGARPLTTPKLIRACLDLARMHGAACCASQIPDTVKRASVEQMVTESVERTGLWAMQTPQVFSSGLILQAYASLMAKHEMVTDEVSAVQKLGKKIALLRNEEWNPKITYPHDLELVEHVLQLRSGEKART